MTKILWRGDLSPMGCEAAPKTIHPGFSVEPRSADLRLLCSRSGINPLATKALPRVQEWTQQINGQAIHPNTDLPQSLCNILQ
jgi:hypothetical protein